LPDVNESPEQLLDDDDAELRRAIKRVRGGHVADEALRSRIAQSLAAESAPAPTTSSRQMSFWRRWAPRIAIAACLLFAGGVLEHIRHKAEERSTYATANDALMKAMVDAHRRPGDVVDYYQVDPFRPAAQIRDQLKARLKRQTPLPDLRSAGWKLEAADVESLNGAVTARLGFAKGDRNATLFSLPQFAFIGAEEGESYDVMIDGYPISGYITRDGVHCIVGDPDVPLSEVTALRKTLQKSSENSSAG
jgi:anti-sigma factor RsiW